MIFSREHYGQWVASKGNKVVDAAPKLDLLLRRVEKRGDKDEIRFDKVPSGAFAGVTHGL